MALLKDPADEGTPSSVGSHEYMSLVSDSLPPRPQSRREFCDGASLVSGEGDISTGCRRASVKQKWWGPKNPRDE